MLTKERLERTATNLIHFIRSGYSPTCAIVLHWVPCVQFTSHLKCNTCVQVSMYLRRPPVITFMFGVGGCWGGTGKSLPFRCFFFVSVRPWDPYQWHLENLMTLFQPHENKSFYVVFMYNWAVRNHSNLGGGRNWYLLVAPAPYNFRLKKIKEKDLFRY